MSVLKVYLIGIVLSSVVFRFMLNCSSLKILQKSASTCLMNTTRTHHESKLIVSSAFHCCCMTSCIGSVCGLNQIQKSEASDKVPFDVALHEKFSLIMY